MNGKNIIQLSFAIVGYVLISSSLKYLIPAFLTAYKEYLFIAGLLVVIFSWTLAGWFAPQGSIMGFESRAFIHLIIGISAFTSLSLAVGEYISPYVPQYKWYLIALGGGLIIVGGKIASKFFGDGTS